jgi:hypothetical protein
MHCIIRITQHIHEFLGPIPQATQVILIVNRHRILIRLIHIVPLPVGLQNLLLNTDAKMERME